MGIPLVVKFDLKYPKIKFMKIKVLTSLKDIRMKISRTSVDFLLLKNFIIQLDWNCLKNGFNIVWHYMKAIQQMSSSGS